MPTRFVSQKDEPLRLFKSDFFEFWTKVHPSVPVILYVPAVAYLFYQASVDASLSLSLILGLFLAGWFAWTLTEYAIHRAVFHFKPRVEIFKRVHYLFHGIHHDYPNDSKRLVMPPIVSLPLAALFYAGFHSLLGEPRIAPFFAGFLLGYLSYDMIHYAIHHFPMRRGFALYLKQHHFRHHFQDSGNGFGVSSPLWDFVFRTKHPHPDKSPNDPRA